MNKHIFTALVVTLLLGGATAYGVNLSTLINTIETNPGLGNGDPIPDNLFDTSGLNPFSNLTINGGENTLATVWEQTITIGRPGVDVSVGSIPNMPTLISVTENNSQFQFYEFPTEQTFVTSGDPFIFSQFNMVGGPMTLNLIDADGNGGNGITPFVNDLFPKVPVDNGTEIAVWQGNPIQVEIVALTLTGLEPIAVNTMVPFQFFGDDTVNPVLDNAFGVFTGDWVLPLGSGVLLDEDGAGPGTDFVESQFLQEWEAMPQFRWKGHPSGWVQVVTGSPPPGPAGIIHTQTPAVPEPSTFVLSILGLLSLRSVGKRRRRVR